MQESIIVSGPYLKTYSPFGRVVESMSIDFWYVSRKMSQNELDALPEQNRAILKMLGDEKSLGVIVKNRSRKEYVINQLYPTVTFDTLAAAIDFLVKNEGQLVFCT